MLGKEGFSGLKIRLGTEHQVLPMPVSIHLTRGDITTMLLRI